MAKSKRCRLFLRSRFGAILGCAFAFLAIILPFYRYESPYFTIYTLSEKSNASYGELPTGFSAFYWSFMVSCKSYRGGEVILLYRLPEPVYISLFTNVIEAYSFPRTLFASYWFSSRFKPADFSIPLITLFLMQVVALTAGLASLLLQRRILIAMAVPPAAVAATLMYLFSRPGFFRWANSSFQLGFTFALLTPLAFAVLTGYELSRGSTQTIHQQK